jgi:hypothetical protein
MKKLLPILLFAGFSSPAFADITHKLSSSVQLTVNAAATQVERVGNTYAVSGNGLDSTYGSGDSAVTNGIGGMTFDSGVGTVSATTFTQDVPGASFSLSQSFVQGDAISTSAPTIGAVSAYSDQVSTAAGTAGNLAGTITTSGAMTVTGGGAGTVATGQFVNELTIN